MWGRIIGLVAGLALLAESYVLWRPEAVGVAPAPDLGPFTQYRTVIALLAASIGAMVVIASLLREPRKRKPAPVDFEAPAEPAPAQAEPIAHDDHHDPHATPAGPVAGPAHSSPPEARHAPEPAHPSHDDDGHGALDPFPGSGHGHDPDPHAAHAEPDAAPEADHHEPDHHEPVLAPPPAQLPGGDRGAFLAAMDEGDQLRAADRLADAIDPYSEALQLARARLASSPQDPTAIRDLGCALTSVADVHDREGRLDSALDLHGESLEIRRALAAQSPDDLAAQRALSLGLEKLADTREARGHRSRARDLFRERLPLAERLAAAAPGDSSLARDLAVTRERLAELDKALSL